MIDALKISLGVLLALATATSAVAEAPAASLAQDLGWDLRYQQVFQAAQLKQHDSLVTAFGRADASEMPIFTEWSGQIPQEAILIDTLAFWYFGYRQQSLMVRTAAGATAYSYFEKGGRVEQKSVNPASFDLLLNHLKVWPQSTPNPTLVAKYRESRVETAGYVGVVSLFDEGKSRQFLLTFEDLMALDAEKGRLTGDAGPFGKLLAAAAASTTEEDLQKRLNADARADQLFSAAENPASDPAPLDNLSKREANQIGRDGRTPLMVAAASGNVAAVSKLIKQGADIEQRAKVHSGPYTALGMAAHAGQKEAVQELLRNGAAVTQDNAGYRPYSEALFEAAHAGHLDIVRILVDQGADLKGIDHNNYTVLNYLFFGGHLPSRDMVELLLSMGVEIDRPNRFGATPLMNAVKTMDRGYDIVALLIERGANVNAVTENGWSVLKEATTRGDASQKIITLLQDKGAALYPQEKAVLATSGASSEPAEVMEIHDVGAEDLETAVQSVSPDELMIAIFCAEWAKPYCPQYRATVEAMSRVADARLVWVTSRNGEGDAAVLAPYRVIGFPHTVVVFRGKVVADRHGALKPDQFDTLVQSARQRL